MAGQNLTGNGNLPLPSVNPTEDGRARPTVSDRSPLARRYAYLQFNYCEINLIARLFEIEKGRMTKGNQLGMNWGRYDIALLDMDANDTTEARLATMLEKGIENMVGKPQNIFHQQAMFQENWQGYKRTQINTIRGGGINRGCKE
ncbi:hypothetical protein M9H77_02237 [Catharanthus roseus]|uniref:Uncharacterized protein n=1 Tax=Catharanthus roseus TaxID=4058 RepID=A0ACC0C7Z5_CATRO|nr:hypothetical protein M9H77_02237 [Catharanthus roseus]